LGSCHESKQDFEAAQAYYQKLILLDAGSAGIKNPEQVLG